GDDCRSPARYRVFSIADRRAKLGAAASLRCRSPTWLRVPVAHPHGASCAGPCAMGKPCLLALAAAGADCGRLACRHIRRGARLGVAWLSTGLAVAEPPIQYF